MASRAKAAGDFEPRTLRRELTLRLAQEALRRARAACGSKTLRESMLLVRVEDTFIRVFVPHYWALFYHEGSEVPAGINMVWFKDKREDPRTAFGTKFPVRVEDIQHLTTLKNQPGIFISKEEFRRLRKQGRIIVTKKGVSRRGRPFFDEGLRDFAGPNGADPIAKGLLDEVLAEVLPSEKATIQMAL